LTPHHTHPQPHTNQPTHRWWLLTTQQHTNHPALKALVARLPDARLVVLGKADADRAVLGERLRGLLAEDPGPDVLLSLLGLADGMVLDPASAGVVLNTTLVQALGDADVPGRLWCVTQGAVSVGNEAEPIAPAQTALWGWGRVVGVEQPQRWGGLIDLPAQVTASVVSELVEVVGRGDGEDQVAVRMSGAWGRRLSRCGQGPAVQRGGEAGWTFPSGTVLVTGGTGALGGHVARWLAAGGVPSLVLVSRRGMAAAGARELADELRESGARVSVVSADVADREAILKVLEGLPAEFPLAGVVHTAGVLDDGFLDELTPERFVSVFRAKADALRTLHEVTAGLPLSMFVAFSSASGAFGAAGQGNYAAANAYLDGFMQWRRAQGLVGTSIAWGYWSGDGIATPAAVHKLHRSGIIPMEPELAVAGMRQALERGETGLMIADVDWARFGEVFTAARPSLLLSELLPTRERGIGGQGPHDGGGPRNATGAEPVARLREQLARLSQAERVQVMEDVVRKRVAMVLGHGDPGAIAATRTFKDLGFDSLMAVEVRNVLGLATGLSLPATLLFDHPNLSVLAEYLLDQLMGDGEQADSSRLLNQLELIESEFDDAAMDGFQRKMVTVKLERMLKRWKTEQDVVLQRDLDDISDDDLFGLMGKEFGIS
ncbi:beta-ketoacyl reductase, partial [Streptomyces olivaceoviridis]|uniref:beta-ketoacyl reductase n=1 Tax=Streptomyces olivaceoviridis TaxID=1921 RepID=UPI0036F51510